MRYLPALYCSDCSTTMLEDTVRFTGKWCNCPDETTSMEHVLGMPEAEKLEQDHSVGHMLPVPMIPDVVSLPELSDAMIAECRAEMAQGERAGWYFQAGRAR